MFAKIMNEETKEVQIGSGDEEILSEAGFSEMEVEQAYDNNWYVKGYAPSKPQSIINAERVAELKALLAEKDYIGVKIATGCATKEDYAVEIAQCEAWREEIRELSNA